MRPCSSHSTRSPIAFTSPIGVRDEQDGDAARAQLVHLAHAALAEIDVADGQRFVHQQDFRIDVDGHGERQAHHHAARVGLHRLIDEVADLGEVFDLSDTARRSGAWRGRESSRSDRRCRGRVNSGLKPAPSSSSAETRPFTATVPDGGLQNAGDDLQQRALAGAVLADDAEGLAALDLEADIVQRPEILVALQPVEGQQLLEPVAGRFVDRVALGNALEFDGIHGWEIERL